MRLDTDTKISPDLSLAFFTVRQVCCCFGCCCGTARCSLILTDRRWGGVCCPCRADDKPAALLYLLREVVSPGQPTIVFTGELLPTRCCMMQG